MNADNDAIGLLGGSFDPVHNGHVAIAHSFLDSPYLSELWILLTPDPPHKENRSLASYESRFQMLQLAFEEWDNVLVSDVEKKLSSPSYTVQTLRHLKEEFPNKTFYLCVGEGSARNFKQWYQWENILEITDLLIARRSSSDSLYMDSELMEKAHLINHEPVSISSTEVRERIARGKNISQLVPKSVEHFIVKHQLYQKNEL